MAYITLTVKHLIKIRNETEMQLSPLRFHALLEELAHATQERKMMKKPAKIWFVNDMLIYPENPGDSIIKLLELTRNFSAVTICKINIQNQKHFYMPVTDKNVKKTGVYYA